MNISPYARKPLKKAAQGFTLIEVMISIAILAIVIPAAFHILNSFKWFSHEDNYSYSLFQAEAQIDSLKSRPFQSLPPFVVTAGSDGACRIPEKHVIPESLKIYSGGRAVPCQAFNKGDGTLSVSSNLKGKSLVVQCRVMLPSIEEAVTVPDKAPFEVHLQNRPIRSIAEVREVSGSSFKALSQSRCLSIKDDTVTLDKSLAGRVVDFTYYGERLSICMTGTFVTDDLKETHSQSQLKLITIEQVYGEKTNSFSLTFLKAGDR
jgi:prepilin-type N-terminal cleavage/methylation domain-containing protein